MVEAESDSDDGAPEEVNMAAVWAPLFALFASLGSSCSLSNDCVPATASSRLFNNLCVQFFLSYREF